MPNRIKADSASGLQLISDSSDEIQIQSGSDTVAIVNSSGITMGSGKGLAGDGSALTGIPNLGVGQTWTNVLASRSAGVTYTNSTGKPIVVMFSDGNSNIATVSINGTKIGELYAATAGVASIATLIIPDGDTYSLSALPDYWWELR